MVLEGGDSGTEREAQLATLVTVSVRYAGLLC